MSTDHELSSIIGDLALFGRENFPAAPNLPGLATALTSRDNALAAVTHVVRDVLTNHLQLTPDFDDLSPVGRHLRTLQGLPHLQDEPHWLNENKNEDATLSSLTWGRIGLAGQRIRGAVDGIITFGIDDDDVARTRLVKCALITSQLSLLDPELRRAAHDHGASDSLPSLDPAHSGALYATAQTLLRATTDRHGTDEFGRPLETAPQPLQVRSTADLTEGLRTLRAQIDNAPTLDHWHVEALLRTGRQLSLLAAGHIRLGADPGQERGANTIAGILDAHTRDLANLPLVTGVATLVPSDTRPLAQAHRCRDFLLTSDGIPFEAAPQVVNAIGGIAPALHRAIDRSLAGGLWAVLDDQTRPHLASPGGNAVRLAVAERLEALARQGLKVPNQPRPTSPPSRNVVASFLTQRAARR